MTATTLIISDNFIKGGLETRIRDQVQVQKELGAKFLLATASSPEAAEAAGFDMVLPNLNFTSDADFASINDTLNILAEVIEKHDVDHIECHPFFGLVVGALLAERTKRPFSMTLHGPASIQKTPFKCYDLIFRQGAIPAAMRVYGVSPETVFLAENHFGREILLDENTVGIPEKALPLNSPTSQKIKMMWAGRVDADKAEGLCDLITKLDDIDVQLDVYGEGASLPDVQKLVVDKKAENRVSFFAWEGDIQEITAQYDVVAGMGRVVLEAAASARPILLVGYDGVKGMVKTDQLYEIEYCNLSGRGMLTISAETLNEQLVADDLGEQTVALRKWIEEKKNRQVAWSSRLANSKTLEYSPAPFLSAMNKYIFLNRARHDAIWLDQSFLQFSKRQLSNASDFPPSPEVLEIAERAVALEEEMIGLKETQVQLVERIQNTPTKTDVASIAEAATSLGGKFSDQFAVLDEKISHLATSQASAFDVLEQTAAKDDILLVTNSVTSLDSKFSDQLALLDEKISHLATSQASAFDVLEQTPVKDDILSVTNNIDALDSKFVDQLAFLDEKIGGMANAQQHAQETLMARFNQGLELSAHHQEKILLAESMAKRVEAIENSFAWKLTAPLRFLGGLVTLVTGKHGSPQNKRAFLRQKVREVGVIGTALWVVRWLATRHLPKAQQAAPQPVTAAQPGARPTGRPRLRRLVKGERLLAKNGDSQANFSQRGAGVTLAMFADNFTTGGVERVILDLAIRMKAIGQNVVVIIANKGSEGLRELEAHGVDYFVLENQNDELEKLIISRNIATAFAHYGFSMMDVFKRNNVNVIEVLHNAYHWQKDEEGLIGLRRDYMAGHIAVSDFVANYNIRYNGIDPDRVNIVNNGMNNHGFIRPPVELIEAKRLATVEAEPHLIFVANLHLQKNHRLLVNAFAKVLKTHPNARLTIAGAFDSDHEIGRLVKGDIKKLKIGKQIDLAGLIDRKALSRLLSKAHIAVLPTLFEGFSIASLEYAYFGLPCVLSRTGAADYLADKYGHACVVAQAALAPDELSNDILETKALHDFNDAVEPLAAAIITILDDYETYSANAVKAARASDEYSIETTAQAYIDIHEAAMNKMGRVAK